MQFFGDISTTFGRIKKNNWSVELSESFYVRPVDEMNFWNPILGLGFLHLRLLVSCRLRTQKAHLHTMYTFSIGNTGLLENFPVVCAQDTRNTVVFGSGSVCVRNVGNVSQQHSPLPRHYWFATNSAEVHCM